MTRLTPLLQTIDALRAELEMLKPLKKADEERLWKKFRLEWNYNSNHIEGNTLTYGQTELLLIFGKTTGDHEMREYEEMKAHDVALKLIVQYSSDHSRELTEADVRELNKIILVRPYWGIAQTLDGEATRKLIQPGEYKKEPNSVKLQNGEMFHYASPEETPAKMADLMGWYRSTQEKKELHPLALAAKLHYDFVRIHPFDDSNGRTSRLLMNYVLMRHNYPPVIIKSVDKRNYLNALNKADVGDLDSFIEYVAEQLEWSLKLAIKAANGESVEEENDLYKEINVWKKEVGSLKEVPIKSIAVMADLYQQSLMQLMNGFYLNQRDNFDNLFVFNKISFCVDGKLRFETFPTSVDFEALLLDYQLRRVPFFEQGINSWEISYSREILKKLAKENTTITATLKIDFHPIRYDVFNNDILLLSKSYSYKMTEREISRMVNISIKETFESIKSLSSNGIS